jgi:hypothetical protein
MSPAYANDDVAVAEMAEPHLARIIDPSNNENRDARPYWYNYNDTLNVSWQVIKENSNECQSNKAHSISWPLSCAHISVLHVCRDCSYKRVKECTSNFFG